MRVIHPSSEIQQELVDKIVARRGRLHACSHLDPARTAIIVIDLDVGSCAREPEATGRVIANLNRLTGSLRAAGGVVAFVTTTIGYPNALPQPPETGPSPLALPPARPDCGLTPAPEGSR